MLGKLTTKRLAHSFRQVRDHVQRGYSTAIKMGTMLDDAVGVASRIHGALKDSGAYHKAPQAHKAIESGLRGYGSARKEVSDRHDNVKNTLARIKASAPEISGFL
jgi:hypothetical protein